jgi:hypothetical protein
MAKSGVTISPDQFATNWGTGMTGSVTKIQDGVMRVQDNPMQKAAESVDKYVAGVQRAAASGRFQASLLAVNLQDWKNTTKQKVGERLAGGVTAAKPKMVKFGQYLIPTVNTLMQTVNQMPTMTLEDSINKMAAWARGMAANPYKK